MRHTTKSPKSNPDTAHFIKLRKPDGMASDALEASAGAADNQVVIGVGVKNSTSDLLIANCDEFIFYDDLVREKKKAVPRKAPARAPSGAAKPAAKSVAKASAKPAAKATAKPAARKAKAA